MKRVFAFITFLTGSISVYACDACEKQQPKILKSVTHGAGPQGNLDYLIVSVAAIIVIATFFFSLKWLLSPGEKSENHIKRVVLSYE